MLDSAEKELYENRLHLKWLSASYGKTDIEKFGEWLMTREGRHTALDMAGIFLDVADVVNTVLYLTERNWGNVALSGNSAIPLMGDFFENFIKVPGWILVSFRVDLETLGRSA